MKPGVRPGLLPGILAALIAARAATRAELKATASPAQRTVLDSRQKALKLAANALYGFTGAPTLTLPYTALPYSIMLDNRQNALYGFTGARPWPPPRARSPLARHTAFPHAAAHARPPACCAAGRTGRPRVLAAPDAGQHGSGPAACARVKACMPAAALQELVQGCARLAQVCTCSVACSVQLAAASRAASFGAGTEEWRPCDLPCLCRTRGRSHAGHGAQARRRRPCSACRWRTAAWRWARRPAARRSRRCTRPRPAASLGTRAATRASSTARRTRCAPLRRSVSTCGSCSCACARRLSPVSHQPLQWSLWTLLGLRTTPWRRYQLGCRQEP